MIDAYVTNLGRYNEGYLDGEYLKLPAQKEDVQALLSRIGVDGVLYEEHFITDYEVELSGLHDCLGEYESIDELNYLAALLDDMTDSDLQKFEAALSYGDHSSSVKELINLTQNLDCYDFIPGIADEDALGRYFLEELSALEIPEYLANYIDYEAYGRDIAMDGGCFAEGGYLFGGQFSFIEHYSGRQEDIPEEYRIFAFPERDSSIRDTLRDYTEKIAVSSGNSRENPIPDHER